MTDITELDPKELVERLFHSMERDLGVQVAAYFGEDWTKMDNEELHTWGHMAQYMKFPDQCSECGQDL